MKWHEDKKSYIKTFFAWLPYSVPQKDGSEDWYWFEWLTVKEEPSYYGAISITLISRGRRDALPAPPEGGSE